MSIDVLQEKIRKQKNPSMVSLELPLEDLPPHMQAETQGAASAYGTFCTAMLEGLKGMVPAVRVPWGMFTLLGAAGSEQLSCVLTKAAELGYYVLLDGPEFATSVAAEMAAEAIFGRKLWPCDAVTVPVYLGSDCIKPFLPYCREKKKDIFLIAKTSNKSAAEFQDLHTGSRLVHAAVMDMVNHYGQPLLGRYSYSQVAAVVGAGAPEAIRTLRGKYQRSFFLADGYDYPNGNAKNCSFAFDRLGHGAVVCAGSSITAAWKQTESDGCDFVERAVESALRMKKNLMRYVTVL